MTSTIEGGDATPATGAVEAQEATSADTSFALSDDVMDNEDLDTITLAAEPTAPSQPSQEQVGATPPAKEGEAATPAKAPVAASTPVAPQTPSPTQTAPPSPPRPEGATAPQPSAPPRPLSGEELVQQLTANRDVLVDAIAKQHFALSQQDVDALEVDAVGTIPKLLARGFYAASVNAVQLINNMVPRMIEHVTTEKVKNQEVETDFFKAWPQIDKNNADHVRTVELLAQSFRQMNPKASIPDAMKYVGTAASAFLGLQAPPATPAKGQSNGRVASAPRTFVPAAAAGVAPTGVPNAPSNPFEGMGLSFDD